VAGKFVSQDPKSFAGEDSNLYRYVGGEPTDYVDATGTDKSNTGLTPGAPIPDAMLDQMATYIREWTKNDTLAEDDVTLEKALVELRSQGRIVWGTGPVQIQAAYDEEMDQIILNRQSMMKYYGTPALRQRGADEDQSQYQARIQQLRFYWATIRLVHELSHAMDERDQGHGRSIDEEERAWRNELDVYHDLVKNYGYGGDEILDQRQESIDQYGTSGAIYRIYRYRQTRDHDQPRYPVPGPRLVLAPGRPSAVRGASGLSDKLRTTA
jgi:hypothetical protein